MAAGLIGDSRGVLVACGQCGQTNRLRYEAIDRETRCGRCQVPLPYPVAPVAVNDAGIFDAMLASSAVPIVVDFWAPWCGPCHAMAPEFEKVARNAAGRWLVVKVDTDRVPELGERYRIMSIPTLVIFEGGREVRRRSGALPAADIERFMAGPA